ncbi:MAG: hypothetical protein SCARUB_02489 [Candidatus Scalindua rubra]|uniref:Uncharacterized protein n=1 Tax=Candidatus Scalindua rubra TaxID=1872076 RepID=A0A1E3X9T4_9BACT|nr:MAG: hypothetical protein SCARUB_02489 [Candidatus Scalindua rubra]
MMIHNRIFIRYEVLLFLFYCYVSFFLPDCIPSRMAWSDEQAREDTSPQYFGKRVANTPWPMHRHDLHHTGRSPYVGTQTNEIKWTFQAGDVISSSPVIGIDGTIYFGSQDKHLYALNPDGSLKWKFETKAEVDSRPQLILKE